MYVPCELYTWKELEDSSYKSFPPPCWCFHPISYFLIWKLNILHLCFLNMCTSVWNIQSYYPLGPANLNIFNWRELWHARCYRWLIYSTQVLYLSSFPACPLRILHKYDVNRFVFYRIFALSRADEIHWCNYVISPHIGISIKLTFIPHCYLWIMGNRIEMYWLKWSVMMQLNALHCRMKGIIYKINTVHIN